MKIEVQSKLQKVSWVRLKYSLQLLKMYYKMYFEKKVIFLSILTLIWLKSVVPDYVSKSEPWLIPDEMYWQVVHYSMYPIHPLLFSKLILIGRQWTQRILQQVWANVIYLLLHNIDANLRLSENQCHDTWAKEVSTRLKLKNSSFCDQWPRGTKHGEIFCMLCETKEFVHYSVSQQV